MNTYDVYVHCSPMNLERVRVHTLPSPYANHDAIYVTVKNVTLEDYAQEWRDKLSKLERRYAYLERGREWAIKNFRGLLR